MVPPAAAPRPGPADNAAASDHDSDEETASLPAYAFRGEDGGGVGVRAPADGGRNHHGRIHLYQRPTNDAAPILGGDIPATAADGVLRAKVNETMSHELAEGTKRNYRNCIKTIINYWKENFPAYYRVGVCQLTPEEVRKKEMFYYGKTEDLKYEGFNVKYFLYFLANYDEKDGGVLKGYAEMRKYQDAILWGAKTAKMALRSDFYKQADTYLAAYRKKLAGAKKDGGDNVPDDKATDPVRFPVYRLLLRRAVKTNNVFAWCWTLLQWNCMARSALIDCLSLHNFSLGVDSIIIKYDESKADKSGERLSEKNCLQTHSNGKCVAGWP